MERKVERTRQQYIAGVGDKVLHLQLTAVN